MAKSIDVLNQLTDDVQARRERVHNINLNEERQKEQFIFEQTSVSSRGFVEFPKDGEGNYRLPLTVSGQPLDLLGMLNAMSASKRNPLWEEAPVFATKEQFESLGFTLKDSASEIFACPFDEGIGEYYHISDTDMKGQNPELYAEYVAASNRGNGEFLQDALFSLEDMVNTHLDKNGFLLFEHDGLKAAKYASMKELETKMECCYWGQDKMNADVAEVTFNELLSRGVIVVKGYEEQGLSEEYVNSQVQSQNQTRNNAVENQMNL